MRITLNVLGMFVLGAAALLAVGLLYHARMIQRLPVRVEASSPIPTGTSGSSARNEAAAAALAGLRADFDVFVNAMRDGRRSDAMRTLDGAYHVADVLQSASDRDQAASALFQAVCDVRRAIQNGRESRAIEWAHGASTKLADAARLAPRRPARLERFIGAMVISPTGDATGTVSGVTSESLEVESGGLRHLLGFIDLQSGTAREIPADAVVFGEPRRFGVTMVLDASR